METRIANNNLPQKISHVKPAAIWARVSTHGQHETSIPTQIDRSKTELERAGYTATHTLQTDWTSLDLFSCPEFQELRSLILNKEIEALALLDRDRLEAQGLQRLIFLSECKQAGVRLIMCQGPAILDEPEGQLVELALAIAKERSVLRARQGSKDGLHDRALKRRLPTSRHKLYGYSWEGERRLVPDENWPNAKLIFHMLLDGASYWPIIQELKKRGILSPQGNPEWNKAAISNMVHNPSYTGRYYALKKQAVTPVKRNGSTYGNSSQKKLPLDEAHYIPEIEIINPPITWEQRLQILDQLAKHQKLAQRNARRDYLLRGMIFCGTHTGKKGEPRAYHGQPHYESWRYTCPVGGCAYPYLNGPKTDDFIKLLIGKMLTLGSEEIYEVLSNKKNQKQLEKRLMKELASCEARYNKCLQLEATLEDRFMSNEIDPEVYPLNKARYQVERKGAETRKRQIQSQLEQIGREKDTIASVETLRLRFAHRLDSLTTAEWRELLSSFGLTLRVSPAKVESEAERAFSILAKKKDKAGNRLSFAYQGYDNGPFFIAMNIPIEPNEVDRLVRSIASDKPEPG